MIRIAAILILFLSATAFAHDDNEPEADWYRGLSTPTGKSCCGGVDHDCNPVAARIKDGSWQALMDYQWIDIPKEAILQHANPMGDAIVCIHNGVVLCFVPPNEM